MLSGHSILVVEDEMLVLLGMETLLEDLGCTSIHTAATVAGALDLIAAESFDAALLDVNLGGDDSYPVADALIAAGTPFLFATGHGGHSHRPDLANVTVLKKPYPSGQLVIELSRLLDPAETSPVAA